ncbi:MAG: hypothetical protein V3G42_05475 [Oscillospiraceae bacterium]
MMSEKDRGNTSVDYDTAITFAVFSEQRRTEQGCIEKSHLLLIFTGIIPALTLSKEAAHRSRHLFQGIPPKNLESALLKLSEAGNTYSNYK